MKSLYDNEMKLEFLSKSNNEAFARISVAAFASQLDPTVEELADIKTAVSEAVTNSIIHGYEGKDGIIKINAKIVDKKYLQILLLLRYQIKERELKMLIWQKNHYIQQNQI